MVTFKHSDLLAGPKVLAYGNLTEVGEYRLHSRFKDLVNWVHDGKLLLTAGEYKYLSPRALIISGINASQYKSLIVSESEIVINGKALKIEKKHEYSGRLDFGTKTEAEFLSFFSDLEQNFMHYFKHIGLAYLLDLKQRAKPQNVFQQALQERFITVTQSVFEKKCTAELKQLRGLGAGLTPAGDDFVAGVLFALHILEQIYNKSTDDLRAKIFHEAKGDNVFSNNFLYLAAQGQYFYRLKGLLEEFFSEKPSFITPLEELFEIGHSSGADLLTGLLLTIKHKIGI